MIVPDRAVVKQSGSAVEYVYVYNQADSTVTFTPVKTGRRLPDKKAYEVLEGLENGSVIVLSGQSRLADGIKAIPLK